jgi:hypothetical protein
MVDLNEMLGARGGYFFFLVQNFFEKRNVFLSCHIFYTYVYFVFMCRFKVHEKVSMLVFSFDFEMEHNLS